MAPLPVAKHIQHLAILKAMPFHRLASVTGVLPLADALGLYPGNVFRYPYPAYGALRQDLMELCGDGLLGYFDSPYGPVLPGARGRVRLFYRVG